jgi:hypothetical protein
MGTEMFLETLFTRHLTSRRGLYFENILLNSVAVESFKFCKFFLFETPGSISTLLLKRSPIPTKMSLV